jgi:hypothetical protein
MKDALWLLCLPTGGSVEGLLKGLHIPLDSQFLVADLQDDATVLTAMYHISDKLQKFRFGSWNASGGLCITSVADFYDRRSDLQRAVIIASASQVHGLATH